MWLPKEERQLLACYYRMTEENEDWSICSQESVNKILDATGRFPTFRSIFRNLMSRFNFKSDNTNTPNQRLLKRKRILSAANQRLLDRKLIRLIASELGQTIPDDIRKLFDLSDVKPTIQGWDLGRKYSNPVIRLGLWFAEYKDCGLGLVIGAILGVIGTIIVNRLSQ